MAENFAFLLPVVLTLFGVAFLIVARFGNRAALFWGSGYLCAALGFLAPLLQAVAPVPLVAMTADAAFLSAFLLYSQGLSTHFDASRHLALRLGIAAVAYGIIAYAVFVAQSLRFELFVSDIACSLLLLVALLSSWRRSGTWVDRALLGAVVFVMLETTLRTIVFFVMAGSLAMDAFIGSSYAFVMQITATIGALLLALTALASVALRIVEGHRKAAAEDPLTGLLNRRGFEQRLGEHAAKTEAAIIVADIDWFKAINDRFGHAAGDEAIREVATLLRTLAWPGVAVARFGGEEFIAYLPNCRLQDAHMLANTLRLALSERDLGRIGIDRPITASFGVAVTAAGDHTIHDAISRADRLLYLAKSNGRNRVVSNAADVPLPAGAKLFVVKDETSGPGRAS
ncbi:GGDEF domain-containing protein [Shinella yambaruensis]|uniref:diguanylate cyclase n=1 Tax=Shinella yambaruensis TaxID=415996 RepID=A0ABQ5ZFB4_9HYPH|nr:GGDEF domain-containing protein [Shinella yambaruensis]MCJ8024167.1 GGDEF domain-containing protein [Shinella yambaruensis]MCU7978684.1 GGDEF domain-containing protein [Shinella yambaruensis]GLR49464.1 GGDEF domain-containing protein [Shinella yambaruensis]